MKHFLLPILLLLTCATLAQPSDFIVLKKRNQTLRNYFPGSPISFTTVNGGNFNAYIERIKKDSLYVIEYMIAQVPNAIGILVLDTLARYRYYFHYNNIKSIYFDKRGFNFRGSGQTLMGGAALIAVGTGVSYLVNPKRTSLPLLFTGLGLGAVGYFLSRLQTKAYTIGKKYRLKYISTQAN